MTALAPLLFDDKYERYWLPKGWIVDAVPWGFEEKFCSNHIHRKSGWRQDPILNFYVCAVCGRPNITIWPIFIFECDSCESNFFIDSYPIAYQLCKDCR